MDNATQTILSAVGTVAVAVVAVAWWRRLCRASLGWLAVGAALWGVAGGVKLVASLVSNAAVTAAANELLPAPFSAAASALYLGLESSLCEIGLTWLVAIAWRRAGRDADRAIGVGVGAGAFEALLFGLGGVIIGAGLLAELPAVEPARDAIDAVARTTPLFFLVGAVERTIAVLCHASTRALVLLGAGRRRPMMVFWGFLLFTLLEAVAGAAHVTGAVGRVSLWWIELMILPLAVASVAVLAWCHRRWPAAERR